MKLDKIDLSNILAVGHSEGQLRLLIDRGEEIEYIEVKAPLAAYEGLQLMNAIASDDLVAIPEFPTVNKPIEMLPVRSSMAAAIGYDESNQTLQVEFLNGSVYQYTDVDSETWEEFVSAYSPGQFYNSNIKGHFTSQRVSS